MPAFGANFPCHVPFIKASTRFAVFGNIFVAMSNSATSIIEIFGHPNLVTNLYSLVRFTITLVFQASIINIRIKMEFLRYAKAPSHKVHPALCCAVIIVSNGIYSRNNPANIFTVTFLIAFNKINFARFFPKTSIKSIRLIYKMPTNVINIILGTQADFAFAFTRTSVESKVTFFIISSKHHPII